MTALIVRSPLHCSRFKTSLFFLFFSGEARLQKPPRVKKSPFLQIRRYSHRKYQVFLSTEWRLFTEYSKDYPLSQQSQHSTPKSLDIRAILIILVFRLDSIPFGNGQCPWLQCVGQVQMAEMKKNLKKLKKRCNSPEKLFLLQCPVHCLSTRISSVGMFGYFCQWQGLTWPLQYSAYLEVWGIMKMLKGPVGSVSKTVFDFCRPPTSRWNFSLQICQTCSRLNWLRSKSADFNGN